MRTAYILNIPRPLYPNIRFYYKICETKDLVKTINLMSESVEIDSYPESMSFNEVVDLIKNDFCEPQNCKEISRKEFDDYYKKTVSEINEMASL